MESETNNVLSAQQASDNNDDPYQSLDLFSSIHGDSKNHESPAADLSVATHHADSKTTKGDKVLDSNTISRSHVPCKFFRQGVCQAGKACSFSHDLASVTDNVCKHFAKGNCKFGYKCANVHILPNGQRIRFHKEAPIMGIPNTTEGSMSNVTNSEVQSLNLGGRVLPDVCYNQPSALANSFYRANMRYDNGGAEAYPQYETGLQDFSTGSQDAMGINERYASEGESTYGSPREEISEIFNGRDRFFRWSSPIPSTGLLVLDFPLPAATESNDTGWIATHKPVCSSIPSKFGMQQDDPVSSSGFDGKEGGQLLSSPTAPESNPPSSLPFSDPSAVQESANHQRQGTYSRIRRPPPPPPGRPLPPAVHNAGQVPEFAAPQFLRLKEHIAALRQQQAQVKELPPSQSSTSFVKTGKDGYPVIPSRALHNMRARNRHLSSIKPSTIDDLSARDVTLSSFRNRERLPTRYGGQKASVTSTDVIRAPSPPGEALPALPPLIKNLPCIRDRNAALPQRMSDDPGIAKCATSSPSYEYVRNLPEEILPTLPLPRKQLAAILRPGTADPEARAIDQSVALAGARNESLGNVPDTHLTVPGEIREHSPFARSAVDVAHHETSSKSIRQPLEPTLLRRRGGRGSSPSDEETPLLQRNSSVSSSNDGISTGYSPTDDIPALASTVSSHSATSSASSNAGSGNESIPLSTVTGNTLVSSTLGQGSSGTDSHSKTPAINQNNSAISTDLSPPLSQPPSNTFSTSFFNSSPAILLFCLVLLLLGMCFQAAGTATYFAKSPTTHDGSFKDPDFLTLFANFWIQSIGLFVSLFGISKLKEPYLGKWAVIVGCLSFACSIAGLGMYFLYTSLGDSLVTLASMLQVWIWMIIVFGRRDDGCSFVKSRALSP